jgi:hypothetical protein
MNKKRILNIAGIIILAVVIYLVFFRKNKDTSNNTSNNILDGPTSRVSDQPMPGEDAPYDDTLWSMPGYIPPNVDDIWYDYPGV